MMLIIRKQQMLKFQSLSLCGFEYELVRHCFEFSPNLCKLHSENQVLLLVKNGIKRAKLHGFTLRGAIYIYIDMILLFGLYFDEDPQYQWCHSILMDMEMKTEMDRAITLYYETKRYLDVVEEPSHLYAFRILQVLGVLSKRSESTHEGDFTELMLSEMKRSCPQKEKHIGDKAMRGLIEIAIMEAHCHGLFNTREVALMVVLMFAFGCGCCKDPLYPWIGRTLNNSRNAEPSLRGEKLESEIMIWLNRVLASNAKE